VPVGGRGRRIGKTSAVSGAPATRNKELVPRNSGREQFGPNRQNRRKRIKIGDYPLPEGGARCPSSMILKIRPW
jgi:hypothetical protein